jgi:hypothetical protein
MPLATLADVTARLGYAPSDTTRAEALIADANAAVASRTGDTYDSAARVVEVWPDAAGTFPLGGHGITSVSAEKDGEPVIVDQVAAGRWRVYVTGPVDVTYTSGWSTPPPALVGIVCQAVIRALGIDPSGAGFQQQSVGPFAVTISSTAAAGPFGFLAGERDVIDAHRRKPGRIRSAPAFPIGAGRWQAWDDAR